MKNKRGMLLSIIGIFLILIAIIFILFSLINPEGYYNFTHQEEISSKKICNELNSTFIKIEKHVLSCNVVICNKNGEILRI